MEEYRRRKEGSEIEYDIFKVLLRLGMLNKIDMLDVNLRRLFWKHDMSGEQWDD